MIPKIYKLFKSYPMDSIITNDFFKNIPFGLTIEMKIVNDFNQKLLS